MMKYNNSWTLIITFCQMVIFRSAHTKHTHKKTHVDLCDADGRVSGSKIQRRRERKVETEHPRRRDRSVIHFVKAEVI